MNQVPNEIKAIVQEVLEESGREIDLLLTMETDFRKDLDFDSLDLALMTVKVEAKFGVDVFRLGIVQTIGEVVERIQVSDPAISLPKSPSLPERE